MTCGRYSWSSFSALQSCSSHPPRRLVLASGVSTGGPRCSGGGPPLPLLPLLLVPLTPLLIRLTLLLLESLLHPPSLLKCPLKKLFLSPNGETVYRKRSGNVLDCNCNMICGDCPINLSHFYYNFICLSPNENAQCYCCSVIKM